VHLVGFHYMNRILIGKLPAADTDKILPAFYVIQKLIAALTTVRHRATFYAIIVYYDSTISPTLPTNHQGGESPCQPSATVFNTQSSFDVPVSRGQMKLPWTSKSRHIRSPFSMWNDYLVPITYEIPVIIYKITSKTYKATKYTFMSAWNTLDD
jgi:hypothetical protein